MALARDAKGDVARLFSGHEDDGGRAASGRHKHIFIAADDNDGDGLIDRLIVAAPWACDRSSKPDRAERKQFTVVSKLERLRAGRLGVIALGRPTGLSSQDLLAGPARLWESRTPYLATRHAGRRKDTAAMLARDVSAECVRRGLPAPAEVEILECKGVADGGGLEARARDCASQGRFVVLYCLVATAIAEGGCSLSVDSTSDRSGTAPRRLDWRQEYANSLFCYCPRELLF
jgi:CRISPR-associated protein Csb2